MNDKFLSFLGIARRAGKVKAGEEAVKIAVKTGKANLVIVAKDASDNTKKRFSNMCAYRNIPILFYGTKESLGQSIGCGVKANIAVTDEKISERLMSILQEVSD